MAWDRPGRRPGSFSLDCARAPTMPFCTAPRISRVAGLVLIDPSLPPTSRYYLKYIGHRLLRLRSWRSVATGKGHSLTMLRERIASALAPRGQFGPWSLQNPKVRSYFEKAYQTLVERGIESTSRLHSEDRVPSAKTTVSNCLMPFLMCHSEKNAKIRVFRRLRPYLYVRR